MVFFSTYATVKNGDFIGNSKVTLRFINSFLGTAERKLTFKEAGQWKRPETARTVTSALLSVTARRQRLDTVGQIPCT